MYISSSSFHFIEKVEIKETIITPEDITRNPFNILKIKLIYGEGNEHEINIFGNPEITHTKLGE